jgi:hypothetical protein
MFMRRGASALWTAKPAVLLSVVATPRTRAMACRPQVDPSILIHRDPRAWEELLGWGCIEAFLEGARFVGVDGLNSLVDYSVSSPSTMRLVLAGVEFAGRRGREWEGYLRGRLEMGARMRFIKVETGVRRDDVWIQISPAYMLLPFDETKRTWQRSAYTLLKYVPDIPTHYKPREFISALLPPELRSLSARGYVWVASVKSRDRYNDALAEWLYWLNHARLPHIDVRMGKFEPGAPVDSLVLSRRRFVGKIGAPTLPTSQGQHA